MSGIAKAVSDKLHFHWEHSIFKNNKLFPEWFWNPKISWKNAYKNNDPKQGSKFFGSQTIFRGFTDGWHITNQSSFFAIVVAGKIGHCLWNNLDYSIIAILLQSLAECIFIGLIFLLFFRKVFERKNK